MGLVLSDVGAQQILNKYFKGSLTFSLRLFVSSTTPSDTDVVSTYTEAVGGGYARQTLTSADFTVAIVFGIATTTALQKTFTFTGPLTTNPTIYGMFIVDSDGILVYSESLPVAFTPITNGDFTKITPVFQLSKGTPT